MLSYLALIRRNISTFFGGSQANSRKTPVQGRVLAQKSPLEARVVGSWIVGFRV